VEGPVEDPMAVARLIAAWARDRGFDLLLTGVMAADDGYGVVGPALGALLDLPHATMIVDLSVEPPGGRLTRELEEGLKERLAVRLPAVLAVQTGLAEPRYVSIMGIRKVRTVPIESVDPAVLGVPIGGRLEPLGLSRPPAGREVQMLDGPPREVAAGLLRLIREVVR